MATDPTAAPTAAADEAEKKRKAESEGGSWFDVADFTEAAVDLVGTAASAIGRGTASAAAGVTETAGSIASAGFETGGAIVSGAAETAGSIASGIVDLVSSIPDGL